MEHLYQIALTLVPGIGDVLGKVLLEHYLTAENIFKETRSGLKLVLGNRTNIIESIINKSSFDEAEKEIAFIEKYKIQTLFYTNINFPQRLKRNECADSPILLYYKGNADLNNTKVIAIVGTRAATNYGQSVVENITKSFANEDIIIVSGLAYGIDTFAHRYALEYNLPTVGVVAHGLHRIYPHQNKQLAKEMTEKGGIITEFRSTIDPCPGIFPKRNRVIAGLCDAVIVVEATRKGGALITAEIANSYNREVFAIPGDLDKNRSEGCNFLIKTHRASLLQDTSDIAYMLGWDKKKPKKGMQQKMVTNLSPSELCIYKVLEKERTCNIDDLYILSQLSQNEISYALLNLELNGIIKCLPGKMYSLQ